VKYPDSCIILFTKAPEPGLVKTRLISALGRNNAAAIYRQFLDQTLETLHRSALAPMAIYCSPSTHHPWFQFVKNQYGVTLYEQQPGDLGQRMDTAISTVLEDTESCVLIGGDCPTLLAGDIDEALAALANGCEIVLGPAQDGGYYLLGARHVISPYLENIDWGSASVFAETSQRLDRDCVKWHCLTMRADIDTIEDYENYIANKNNAP
jgi:rSAM/selenodomain-associated transferase 1